jgi:hypothetical protein
MHPFDSGPSPHTRDTDIGALACSFSPDELAQLFVLREHFQEYPDHGDSDAAIRRLEFARWLYLHGRLTDG